MAAKVYVLYVVGRIIVLSKHGLRLVLELSYKQICGECESQRRAGTRDCNVQLSGETGSCRV